MTDPLKTMLAEIDYGISILRPHYPDEDDASLKERAMAMRPKCYQTGRWPTDEELADQKVAEELAAKKAAEAAKKAAEEAAKNVQVAS